MNLFDDAEWLKIPELKKLDDELLNYINYIYNEFPNLHYTDDQWVNIIKWEEEKEFNKDISKFMQEYVNLYINNSVNISTYAFIKYDTNRLKNIIKQLSIKQIYHMLNSTNCIDNIFLAIKNIKKFKHLYLFSMNHERLYLRYIHVRIIDPITSVIISYLLSKYSNDNLINFYRFMDSFLINFYCRKNGLDNNEFLLNCINSEYAKRIYPYAYDLYNYYLHQFIINPNSYSFNVLLSYNIKLINNKDSLKIVNFVKKQKSILTKNLLNVIIASCNLAAEQINELKAYHLLSNL